MATKLIVIIGITGLQGGSVAKVFQTLPGWRIRGITRDPTKASAAPLRDAGIELVAADLDDQASLEKAFEGANAIFAVTDFWQFLQNPATFEKAQKDGKAPNQVCFDLEVQQGKNIANAAAKQLATLDRLVLSTLSDSVKWSNGEITHNLHFDAKAKFTNYVKESLPELANKTSYLQLTFYLSNWRSFPFLRPSRQEDGSYGVPVLLYPNSKALPYVDEKNDTGYFVQALVKPENAGKTMLGYRQKVTPEEYVRIWGETLGVKSTPKELVPEVMVAGGLPDFMVEEMADMVGRLLPCALTSFLANSLTSLLRR